MRHQLLRCLSLVSFLIGLSATSWATTYTFTTIDVPGAVFETAAGGINNAGQIVGRFVSSSTFTETDHGFLDSAGTFTTIDVPLPGAFFTEPLGINDAGEIVGRIIDSNVFHGFLRTAGIFTAIDAPGSSFTRALGINDAGQIVGDFVDSAGRGHGVLRTAGIFTI